ncbi:MAG: VOC family protein [Gammaproteobacteria bacterium]|nr:MAG: VOC family protein [Gammaproteobacteria bacterium]
MIGYITLGTDNLGTAGAFYDALLGELGAKRFMSDERMIVWGADPRAAMLAVCTPYDEEPASVGNGTMVALNAGSEDKVRALHKKALELGASNEGDPGPRGENFFGAYFRDLDGNKLCVFKMGADA